MLDFIKITTRSTKKDVFEVYPKFIIKKSSDLMIRGGDFYAIWIEERNLWSTDEQDALQLIDRELDKYAKEHGEKLQGAVHILHMWDAESGMIDRWHKYCQKQMRDNYQMLDGKLIFSNMETKKTDYASKKLPYPLEPGDLTAYDNLMSVLYSEKERHKIEWAVGSIVSGASCKLQKFLVLYGSQGTGKGTVLDIIKQLFAGYDCVFDAKTLGSSNSAFALEPFKSNPLVAIQYDGDMSRIEDNTRINSLVSHEEMTVNEKFKSVYSNRFHCFLFMGSNKPVKITDAKSGLIRRLIDVSPTGNKLDKREYDNLKEQIPFELGAIAYHCKEVYENDPHAYDDYIPINMLGSTNDFYNFIIDSYHTFKSQDSTTLGTAWEMYKVYCEDAKVLHPMPKRAFSEELKNYFRDYEERAKKVLEDGTRPRGYYSGFLSNKFEEQESEETPMKKEAKSWIDLKATESIFDTTCGDFPAQYASENGTPYRKWENVATSIKDLDTSRLHYVKVPENHIVIDFDIPDETGKKNLELNLKAASKFPPTYAELSMGGSGLHLHYIYTGDPSQLAKEYAEHVEIKAFSGNSSLRRKLTKCNSLPISAISSGLPLREKGEKMVDFDAMMSEKGIRSLIKANLNKEIHPGTKPSIDFIAKILDDAWKSGNAYDVTDMQNAVLGFAAQSTHHADYCIKLVNKMQFKSKEVSDAKTNEDQPLVFYDVEVFPNLFLVNWKKEGADNPVMRMINPTPAAIEQLIAMRLVGFNCRRYDNHILYGRLLGYNNEQLYNLSQRIVSGDRSAFFGEAYNVSYTDVYDFSSKKQSLKKFEIELGIHHKELGLPWDQPVPEEMWGKVAEYCDNDVLATEAVFHARKSDFTARQILADVAGMTVNDTTNSLTTRIIFGTNRHPQDEFNYRDLGDCSRVGNYVRFNSHNIPMWMGDARKNPPIEGCDYILFDSKGRPIFPGYKYEKGKSTYRGEEVGEGGYVYAQPGIYGNVTLLDIASMHPSSIIAEELFGLRFTKRFKDLVDARLAIKHKDFDKARTMLDGKLAKYLTDEASAADLAQALKIAINSVYGLTSASFDNPFRDKRNVDNIVAKRGALFMINLKHEVQSLGFTVAHIKTDSIKIPDATPEIIRFVMEYGKLYGYTFEHEATYDRMCLVNDAVYIAKYKDADSCKELYGYIPGDNKKHGGEWTATGTQFAVPYVFKTLFSKEALVFDDMCETKSVSKGAIYLDMNENLPDVKPQEKELAKLLKQADTDGCLPFDLDERRSNLEKEIAVGHDYRFIGRVGQFTPIKDGCGGGELVREDNGKYYAVTGTKGYRWLESETLRTTGKEDIIDKSYYDKLVEEAIKAISEQGDYEWFVSDEPYIGPDNDDDYLPF